MTTPYPALCGLLLFSVYVTRSIQLHADFPFALLIDYHIDV